MIAYWISPRDGGRVPVGDVLVGLPGGRPAPVAQEDERRDEDQPAREPALVDDATHVHPSNARRERCRRESHPGGCGAFLVPGLVADVQGTRSVDAEPLEREPEDGGLRLRRSRLRGGRDHREERCEPEALEVLREADVPVGDDRELEPPRAQGMERLDRAGLGLHHDRAHERVDERRGIEVGICGLQEDPRALLPQRRQARGVAALECSRPVVGDFRPGTPPPRRPVLGRPPAPRALRRAWAPDRRAAPAFRTRRR